jgi:hypothetical protein
MLDIRETPKLTDCIAAILYPTIADLRDCQRRLGDATEEAERYIEMYRHCQRREGELRKVVGSIFDAHDRLRDAADNHLWRYESDRASLIVEICKARKALSTLAASEPKEALDE